MLKYFIVFILVFLSGCVQVHENSGGLATTDLDNKSLRNLKSADFFYSKGQLTEAEHLFLELLKKHPNYAYAWFRLGNIHARVGQLLLAEKDFQRVIEINPKNGKAWNNLALVRVKQAIIELEESKHFIAIGSVESNRLIILQEKLMTAIR